jgi:hypothetical protein
MANQQRILKEQVVNPVSKMPKPTVNDTASRSSIIAPAGSQQRVTSHPNNFSYTNIIQLQRSVGNRAVGTMLGGSSTQHPIIQAKLMVNAPGDKYEQEADRVAEQVMRFSSVPKETSGKNNSPEIMKMPRVRSTSESGMAVEEIFERGLQTNRGKGQPLPPGLREEFETKFDADFGAVRIHADNKSAQMNQAVKAKAFTHGHDIYLGANQPLMQSKPLIAHELTHVVQQTGNERNGNKAAQPMGDVLPIQRLALDNTDWSRLTSATRSSSGAGGVLIMEDGTNEKLVVKPQVRAADELIYSRLGKGSANIDGKWQIKGLDTRLATTKDKTEIQNLRDKVAKDDRAKDLIDKIDDNNTTMIQEAGTGEEMKDLVKSAKNMTGGHIKPKEDRESTVATKNKVRDNSPYKLLMKKSFVQGLGVIAARDIFVGNFDRLIDKINLENFFVNNASKSIIPIDNMDVGDYAIGVAKQGNFSNDQVFTAWCQNQNVIDLKQKKFKDIAERVMDPAGSSGGHTGLLLEALRTELGLKIKYMPKDQEWRGPNNNTDPNEALLIKKLIEHRKEMIDNFALGLKNGLKGIKKQQEINMNDDGGRGLSEGIIQYNKRYKHLFS